MSNDTLIPVAASNSGNNPSNIGGTAARRPRRELSNPHIWILLGPAPPARARSRQCPPAPRGASVAYDESCFAPFPAGTRLASLEKKCSLLAQSRQWPH